MFKAMEFILCTMKLSNFGLEIFEAQLIFKSLIGIWHHNLTSLPTPDSFSVNGIDCNSVLIEI